MKQPRFEAEAASIQPNVSRMDGALAYVEGQLARDPESGLRTVVPGIFVAPTRVPAPSGIVWASVFYTFMGDYVWLQSIRLAP